MREGKIRGGKMREGKMCEGKMRGGKMRGGKICEGKIREGKMCEEKMCEEKMCEGKRKWNCVSIYGMIPSLTLYKAKNSHNPSVYQGCGCCYYGFSQLSTSEFLKREMEMHETKNHLLCGWCNKCL